MSTPSVSRLAEADILSVVRELESRQPVRMNRKDSPLETAPAHDPSKLLESLQKKRQLINLIDGYTDASDMNDMKTRINEAIADLEEIIGAKE